MKDRIDRAFETLKGYCSKRAFCDRCRYDNKGQCALNEDVPVGWEKPEKNRGEQECN